MSKKSTGTSSYSQQYKDPRWQKRRLEILDRDNFMCRRCASQDSTLHVHHIHYEKGKKIWEARSQHLITLCSKCHDDMHYYKDIMNESFNELVASVLINCGESTLGSLFGVLQHYLGMEPESCSFLIDTTNGFITDIIDFHKLNIEEAE